MHSSRIQSSIILRMRPPLGCQKMRPAPATSWMREEVELLAEHAVVARLDLFEMLEVRVEILLREEGGAVDALQLLVLFVAQPVGSGDGRDLERLHAAGGRNVRAAAEVSEVAVLIERDLVAGLGEALDEVDLHELALGCS